MQISGEKITIGGTSSNSNFAQPRGSPMDFMKLKQSELKIHHGQAADSSH